MSPRRKSNIPLTCPQLLGHRFSSLTVNLSIDQRVYVAAGIVRWVRGEEYGVETLVMDVESQEDVEDYLWQWQ